MRGERDPIIIDHDGSVLAFPAVLMISIDLACRTHIYQLVPTTTNLID